MARRYTRFLETGSDRGALYNHAGQNLTDGVPGAGTNMVGPWSRDFIGVMPENGVTGRPIPKTNELSFIVADGRLLNSATLDYQVDPYEPDFNQDEEPEDRHSLVQAKDSFVGVDKLAVRLSCCLPSMSEGAVYALANDTGAIAYVDNFANWLDDIRDIPDDVLPDATIWPFGWQHLRCPLHWALYKVTVNGTTDEKLGTMVSDNSATPAIVVGQLSSGPYGMLRGMYGPTYAEANMVRLWDNDGSLRVVDQGEAELALDLAKNFDNEGGTPDTVVDVDIIDLDPTAEYVGERNSVVTAGRNFHLTFRSRRYIALKPDEVLIFHVQTGWARVGIMDAAGAPEGIHLIWGPGGGVTDSDYDDRLRAGGSLLSWYRWTAHAWHYDTRPKRRRR